MSALFFHPFLSSLTALALLLRDPILAERRLRWGGRRRGASSFPGAGARPGAHPWCCGCTSAGAPGPPPASPASPALIHSDLPFFRPFLPLASPRACSLSPPTPESCLCP